MVQETVAQHPSKARRIIELLVLLAIIVGIVLVLAELVINVLPEIGGRPSVSQVNQVQNEKVLDNSAITLYQEKLSETPSIFS
jgi:hypothetical protein